MLKCFNQRFTFFLKKSKDGSQPTQELQMEVYGNALPIYISMFVKRNGKDTLLTTFEEAKKNEFEMLGCK
jgi:hypothetical protein